MFLRNVRNQSTQRHLGRRNRRLPKTCMVAYILKQPVLHARKKFRRSVPLLSSGTQVERHRYTVWTECSLCMLQHMTCAVATTLNGL